jgi:CubicO group peptidase (beta-lactamase class C family)
MTLPALLVLACSSSYTPAPQDSAAAAPQAEDTGLVDPAPRCEASPASFPVPEWPSALPEDHGFDPAGLAEAADYASLHDSNCLVVVRHGAVVGEWYWQDTTPTTLVKNWSVAKSYTSTVVGLALERGDLDSLDQPAADFIPAWQDTEHAAITVHDLLSMSSGLEFDLLADNITMPLADDMSSLAVAAPVTNPAGALWEYNNHSVQALEPVLRAATGMAADAYADEYLFEPLGMDVDWKRDAVGQPAMYMNSTASCRDHARLGYLYLQRGCWDGQELLSEAWIDAATGSSTSQNRGYGYYWWLSGEDPTLDSVTFESKGPDGLHGSAPDDSFCAAGLGSQFIEVVPSLDLVVVRMGTAPHDDLEAWLDPLTLIDEVMTDGEQIVHNGVLERVLDALVDP